MEQTISKELCLAMYLCTGNSGKQFSTPHTDGDAVSVSRVEMYRPGRRAGRPRAAPLPRSAYADDHRRSDMPKSLIFCYIVDSVETVECVGPDPHPRATRKMLRKRETPAKGHYRFLQFTSRPAVPKACGNLT